MVQGQIAKDELNSIINSFETAIKEAEQIVYFLILTGVSIATAANSYLFKVESVQS